MELLQVIYSVRNMLFLLPLELGSLHSQVYFSPLCTVTGRLGSAVQIAILHGAENFLSPF